MAEMHEFSSNSKGNLAVTLGAIGTGLGILGNGGLNLGGLLGGGYNNRMMYPGDGLVDRYENSLQARIADLETQVKLRDANIYTDSKSLEMYKYFDGELRGVHEQLARQAVMNQKTADAFEMVKSDICCVKNELYSAICRERDDRACADNTMINYVNATFAPKLVADYTAGTETTPQFVYNPLMRMGGGCCCK